VLDDPPAEVTDLIAAARSRGMRVEGHAPGASPRTLGVSAAAGITADHEARRGEEVIERLRAGLWAFIRHTDTLRDAPAIVASLLEAGVSLERTGFTTDWSLPPWIAHHGIIDAVVEAALGAGMPPEQAYACASQRPATYLGLDAHFGLVAPGRLASVNVLDDPAVPLPRRVFSLGREVARDGELLVEVPDVDWEAAGAPPWSERRGGPVLDTFRPREGDPEISLEESAVVHEGRGSAGGAAIVCAALDASTGTFTRAAIFGMPAGLEGIASTLTPRRLLVAVGADPAAIERCVDAVIEAGGGIAYQQEGELRLLPLPVGGAISPAPFATVLDFWEQTARFFESLGHDLADPLSTLLYIGSDSLPGARFTARGLVETRSGRLIEPSREAQWK
jgi:adenine deaminase